MILEQMVLGVVRENKCQDIFSLTSEDCYNIATKAVRYQEYVGEMLARTQKRRKDAETRKRSKVASKAAERRARFDDTSYTVRKVESDFSAMIDDAQIAALALCLNHRADKPVKPTKNKSKAAKSETFI